MKNRLRKELEAMLGLHTGDSFTADNVHTLVNGIFAADEGGGFEYVEYDNNAFPYPQTIGSTAQSISGLGPADESMIDTIFIMPNKETDPDATMMIVVDEKEPSTDPKTYQYVYVGNINDLPSDVLTEGSIVNDLTTGGTDKPLSAEQGRTLNSHVNYTTCGSGAADQVKLISDDGFELSTHLRLLVRMTNTNTHATPKFNVNNTGVKDVWYNGSVASDTNTWAAGEVLDVYYDGGKYIASTHGGAQFVTGEKVGDVGIDDEPTAGSENLVKSGGVYKNNLSLIYSTLEGIDNFVTCNYALTLGGLFGSNANFDHIYLKVNVGDNFIIKTPFDGYTRIAFATSNSYSSLGSIPLVTGTSVFEIPANTYREVTIPQDCEYLLLYNYNNLRPWGIKKITDSSEFIKILNELDLEVNGGDIYKSYRGGANTYVALSTIKKKPGDIVYFKYNGDLSDLLIYSATSSGLSTVQTITSDSVNSGHFTISPTSDTITRISIRHDDTRFLSGETISFLVEETTGLDNKVSDLEENIPTLSGEVESLSENVSTNSTNIASLNFKLDGGPIYKSYQGGSSKYVLLTDIQKAPGDTVYFTYDGNINDLLIYSAKSSGLSTVQTITVDSSTSGHFTISPNSDLITRLYILHDNTRFLENETISFLVREVIGLESRVENLEETSADKTVVDELNLKVNGGPIYKSYQGGATKYIPLTEIGKRPNDVVYFTYNGNINDLLIYSATSSSAYSSVQTIVVDSSTSGHFTISPNSDLIVGLVVIHDNTRFPSGSTLSFIVEEVTGLDERVSSLEETSASKEWVEGKGYVNSSNLKTINNISLIGEGNITISGGGSGTNFVNAADYGFLPENSASDNVSNLQAILTGGNITIYVTVPGTYMLNATLILDSNTELVFGKGVTLKKVDYVEYTGYAQVFRNRGASSRTEDSNIIIRGLSIDGNNSLDLNGLGTPCYGLRAHLGFMCIDGLQLYDYSIKNLGEYSYGLQLNDCKNVIVDGFSIIGAKDGVHISSIDGFVIRNGIISTSDDGLALNAGDWLLSNCIDGPIRNGIIENIVDKYYIQSPSGNFIRLHNAAWTDWQSGMIIQRGDKVISNGNLYKADCAFNATSPYRYRSTHQPTYDSYSGVQDFGETDIDGLAPTQHLRWILVKKNVSYHTADVQNIIFRGLSCKAPRRFIVTSTDTKSSVYSRTIYIEDDSQSPILQYSAYPHDIVKFEDCALYQNTTLFTNSQIIKSDLIFNNIRESQKGFSLNQANSNLPSSVKISDFDFRKVTDNTDIICGSNIRVVINNAIKDSEITTNISGSCSSNSPISTYPMTPKIGDSVIVSGAIKCWDGSSWN